MATIELVKSNENCSNIFFIDEDSCAGSSLDLINNNFAVLSANLIDLSRKIPLWESIFANFAAASATVLSTLFNIENIESTIASAYTCVRTFSGNWVKQFSLYIPTVYNINDWESRTIDQKDVVLNTWLTLNFPPDFYPDYQIVNIFVNTNQFINFAFEFSRSYEENCAPNGGTTTVTCNGCNSGNQGQYRNQGCNDVRVEGRKVGCGNVFQYCGVPTSQSSNSRSITCIANSGQRLTGFSGGPLKVGLYDENGTETPSRVSPIRSNDTCYARTYSYKYIKTFNEIDGARWNIIL
jgi:hypothetical protein